MRRLVHARVLPLVVSVVALFLLNLILTVSPGSSLAAGHPANNRISSQEGMAGDGVGITGADPASAYVSSPTSNGRDVVPTCFSSTRADSGCAVNSGSASGQIDPSSEGWFQPAETVSPNTISVNVNLPFAYDPSMGFSVLYDCTLVSCSPETWSFNASGWTPVNTTTSPGPGVWSMTYDAGDGYVLLYGGKGGYTWEFSGGQWTNITGPTGPFLYEGAAISYDPHDGYCLLYGGADGAEMPNSSWIFKAGSWSMINISGDGPGIGSVFPQSIVYDPQLQSLVFFDGGSNYTYLYQAGVWTAVYAPPPVPGGIDWGSLSYDPLSGRVLYFGGYTENNSTYTTVYHNELWAFNGTSWVDVAEAARPPATAFSEFTYDSSLGWLIATGGTVDNETWIWGAGNVSFEPTPMGGGSIDFGGTLQASSGSAWEPFGIYTIRAEAATGYRLTGLNISGNLTLSSGVYDLTGNATVDASFAPYPRLNIESRPAGCPVSFNGTTYENNSSVFFLPGTFSLTAPACGDLTFGWWSVVGNGSVAVRSDNVTTLALRGSATIEANWLASIVVYVNPSGAGSVEVNGSIVNVSQALEWIAGNYTLSVQASPGWRFGSYTTEGGVVVLPDEVEVSAPGWLLVNFTAYPSIASNTSLSRCEGFELNGTLVSRGQSTAFLLGTYNISAPVCSDALFDRWNGSADAIVADPYAVSSTVTVTGNGSLDAIYESAAWVSFAVSPTSASGTIIWNGQTEPSGANQEVPLGNYSVRATTAQGWTFAHWIVTGGVVVNGSTATVESNGTLNASFTPAQTQPPPATGSGPATVLGLTTSEWGLIGILIAAIAVVATVVTLRRRRMSPPLDSTFPP